MKYNSLRIADVYSSVEDLIAKTGVILTGDITFELVQKLFFRFNHEYTIYQTESYLSNNLKYELERASKMIEKRLQIFNSEGLFGSHEEEKIYSIGNLEDDEETINENQLQGKRTKTNLNDLIKDIELLDKIEETFDYEIKKIYNNIFIRF